MNHEPLPLGAAQSASGMSPGGSGWCLPALHRNSQSFLGCFVCGKPSWSRGWGWRTTQTSRKRVDAPSWNLAAACSCTTTGCRCGFIL